MIIEWLDGEDYQPQVEKEVEGTEWVVRATMPNGWEHVILQRKDNEEAVELESKFTFLEDEVGYLTELQAREALELLWDIRMGLLFRSTEFQMLPPKQGFPEGFAFRRQLSYDGGLDRNTFMEALRELHKCLLFVNWSVKRKMELTETPESPTLKARFVSEGMSTLPENNG